MKNYRFICYLFICSLCSNSIIFADTAQEEFLKQYDDYWNSVYEVTLPYSKKVIQQNLTKGILISEANSEADEVELNFTPTWNTTDTANRYIIVSKSPIELEKIVTGTNTNNFLNLKMGNESGKYLKLSNGTKNTITIKSDDGSEVMQKGDLLYFKILWDVNDTNRTYPTTITEPQVYYTG